MKNKISIGIIGATGTVGQKLLILLENHPWFEIKVLAASKNSAGKIYGNAVEGKWVQSKKIPTKYKKITVLDSEKDFDVITAKCSMVFSCVSGTKESIKAYEEKLASHGVGVVSTSSANRMVKDVPMVIPEINPEHIEIIDAQRRKRNWSTGFIAVKPNCSIQSYVPAINGLRNFKPKRILVSTYQAISGAGKTFSTWPEMEDNVIPFIKGEEEKSEIEPLKIWGTIKRNEIINAKRPIISAQCIRVPVTDGHLATVSVEFEKNPTKNQILQAWKKNEDRISRLKLPSSTKTFVKYFEEEDRPQTRIDRDFQDGMGITIGRLRKDSVLHWKFVCLSHNTIRGAAGGALLLAELLHKKGYISQDS